MFSSVVFLLSFFFLARRAKARKLLNPCSLSTFYSLSPSVPLFSLVPPSRDLRLLRETDGGNKTLKLAKDGAIFFWFP